ncbi:hypothetical protein CAL7716_023880 [Calothrix sp. PCC 7716]|nr:hypothetical protein CAL7716_023880 [Calothrix sp. PCC 7716]
MEFEQLALFSIPSTPSTHISSKPIYDPCWDTEIIAPEHTEEKWKEADFGEVPFKSEADQLTIFYDDSHEPPEPDDFNSIEEFEEAWCQWQSVRGQVTSNTQSINSSDVTPITSQSSTTGVREQITQAFELAPEHMQLSSDEDANETSYLLPSPQYPVNSHTSNNNPSQKKQSHWIEPYWVKRANKKHKYYRYCWMEGRKIKRVHIGSTCSNIAKQKRQEVLQLISNGKQPDEITRYLKQP